IALPVGVGRVDRDKAMGDGEGFTERGPRLAVRCGHPLADDDDSQPWRADNVQQEVVFQPALRLTRQLEGVEDEECRTCGLLDAGKDLGELAGDTGAGRKRRYIEAFGKEAFGKGAQLGVHVRRALEVESPAGQVRNFYERI